MSTTSMTQNSIYQQTWFTAAINDHLDVLKNMYNKNIVMQDYRGRTACMLAIHTASPETLTFLHEHEQCVQEDDGYTALMFAAQQKNLEALKIFYQNEMKMQSNVGNTALMCAAAVGFVEAIFYLQAETQLQNQKGQTALMIAAAQGHLGFVKMLIHHEKGMRDSFQRTATMYAAASGQYECLKFLIQHENENDIDQDGNSSLFYAINSLNSVKDIQPEEKMQQQRDNCINCVNLFYQENTIKQTHNFKKQTLLMMLAKHDLVDQMNQILEQQVRQQDENGRTALMYAAMNDSQKASEKLAEYEIKMQDKDGKTATMYAAEVASIYCVNHLVEQEQDINDYNGLNIMMHAIKSGDEHLCRVFVDKHMSEKDNQMQNPAHYACKYGHLDILRMLVKESNQLLNQRDINGRIPLHTAAIYDQSECIEYIIKQKKDLQHVQDNNGQIPLDTVVHFDNYKAFATFLEYGDPNTFKNIMIHCVAKNSYKILKFVTDVSRVGKFTQFNDKHNYSSKQQKLCKNLLQQQDSDGHDLLQYAILSGVQESIKILTFVLPQSNYKGLSPLMLLAQRDTSKDVYDDQTLQLLVQFFGGQQLKTDQEGFPIGTTALMIACSNNVNNERLIKALLEVEKEIDDVNGKKAKDYAVISGRIAINYYFTE